MLTAYDTASDQDDDRSRMSEKIADMDLDYQDAWPNVEVTIAINEVLQLDIKEMTFEADFAVYLDWVDPRLKPGVHYDYNAEKGKFELAPTLQKQLLEDRGSYSVFNPFLEIANEKKLEKKTSPAISIVDEQTEDGKDVPWLCKKFEFIGALHCPQVNARVFPFDVQGLQIKVQCAELEGVTSLGQPRTITLLEPRLRRATRQRERLRSRRARMRMIWADTSDENQCMSHMWRLNDEDGEAFGFGEMQVLAMGGTELGSLYAFHVVLQRQWYPRYVADFVIQNLQVLLASTSLWIPFNVDTLANRMGIALMVLLTLVASTNTRPAMIDTVPYSTLHDSYGQFMVLLILLISVANWYVFVNCWGFYRTPGEDDYWDADLHMVVNTIRDGMMPDAGLCQEGFLGASRLDTYIFMIQLIAQFLLIWGILIQAQMARITTLLYIKCQLDEPAQNPGENSQLVLCDNGFEFMRREDISDCSRRAGLLPFTGCFIWLWGHARHLRRKLEPFWPMEDGTFHAMDFLRRIKRADELRALAKTDFAPGISNFRGYMPRTETSRFLDVGSGEMGFYSYWVDQDTGLLGIDGGQDKLKYKKGCTFVDHFVDAPDGPQDLAREIAERFKLAALSSERPSGGRPTSTWTSADSGRARKAQQSIVVGRATEGPLSPIADSPSEALDCVVPVLPSVPSAVETPELEERDGSLASCTSPRRTTAAKGDSFVERCTSSKLPGAKKKKMKLFMCLTGANRQMLSEDSSGRQKLRAFVKALNKHLEALGVECVEFSPQDKDEAMYELRACEWVVQHGDLDVKYMRLGGNYRNLQHGWEDGLTTLEEVLREFRWLNVEKELTAAYDAAAEAPGAGLPCVEEEMEEEEEEEELGLHVDEVAKAEAEVNRSTGSSLQVLPPPEPRSNQRTTSDPTGRRASRADPAEAARDLRKARSSVGDLRAGTPAGVRPERAVVRCRDFYSQFESSMPLMRALVRSKEFVGTMSAGSGSCQVTLRETFVPRLTRGATLARGASLAPAGARKCLASIPLGNRSPMTAMRLKLDGGEEDDDASPLSKNLPMTRQRTLALLGPKAVPEAAGRGLLRQRPARQRRSTALPTGFKDAAYGNPGVYITTQPAWPEDGPVSRELLEEWRDLVVCCAEEVDVPRGQRGLFVGITAFFYAAKLAGCEDRILEKSEFLDALEAKKEELLESGGTGRDLANLTLVAALGDHVMHNKAKIVCKRTWLCSEPERSEPMKVVATWTLGFFLRHLAAS
ncbi:unnamed protein product [Prorocentrum cordatum]|uniref:Uncharacterized protein n=1 Tax=Prorocentrum cordatum TaxID=2364126 RepID=A0ABN9VCG2_9DINO|nr:unnamed protein product [Polarella glacialis]